ncbi:MAG: hypothetical protein MUO62_08510 [Anaerolineales bacterium]|nr:hypothetical protein [Anaerolineales bacterium]
MTEINSTYGIGDWVVYHDYGIGQIREIEEKLIHRKQVAAEAQVGRLVLIHLSGMRPESGEPELDRVQSIFPQTEVAFDRMEIEF